MNAPSAASIILFDILRSALPTPHWEWLPRLDSHQDRRGQSPVCCCYTTRQENAEFGVRNAELSRA